MPTQEGAQKNIVSRPPIVCVMGHVDHGKSTLLEYIKKIDITTGEAGGITQKIGAYEIAHEKQNGEKRQITFLDTPGHEAFGTIRSRGANVADIAILVVSAEDGVKPQTLDAYSCIKNAKLPFIVAINKIDKPGANIEQTKQSLAEHEIYLEGYGGDIPWSAISAKKGDGVPELLELIDLVAEINNVSGNPNAPATGFVVETNQDSRRGSAASLIIRDGSLNQGDFIVSGDAFAPIRIMENDRAELIKKASMGTPVRVIGWNKLPDAGLTFVTVKNKKEAEILAESNREISKEKNNIIKNTKENLALENQELERISIPIIIKGDATGTLDAIAHELKKIETEKVKIKLVHQGVGDISEKDAKTAESVKGSIVIGFNVGIDSRAKNIIERSSLEIKIFDIIYKLSDWLTELIKEKTPKVQVPEKHGSFKVLKIFSKDKDKQIIGARMIEGNVSTGNEVKIMRRENEIGVGKVRELQKQKNRVDEISAGVEFGTMIEAKVVIAVGDVIEPFVIIEK